MNTPARTVPPATEEDWIGGDPTTEPYTGEEAAYTEWRGPDKPGPPGVHVVAYVILLGLLVALVAVGFGVRAVLL